MTPKLFGVIGWSAFDRTYHPSGEFFSGLVSFWQQTSSCCAVNYCNLTHDTLFVNNLQIKDNSTATQFHTEQLCCEAVDSSKTLTVTQGEFHTCLFILVMTLLIVVGHYHPKPT